MGKAIEHVSTYKLVLLGFVSVLVILGVWIGFRGEVQNSDQKTTTEVSVTVSPKPQETTHTYKGKEGIDALTLLKESANVEEDTSGLVVSINNRKADATKREYWAFYVNGKLAPVGPSEYKTKDTDSIEWRIEKY